MYSKQYNKTTNKPEIHLNQFRKKVLNYMLENNLTQASTKRKKYILKKGS